MRINSTQTAGQQQQQQAAGQQQQAAGQQQQQQQPHQGDLVPKAGITCDPIQLAIFSHRCVCVCACGFVWV